MIAKNMVKERIQAKLESMTDKNTEMVAVLKSSDQYRNFVIGLTNELIKATAIVAKRGRVKSLSDKTINETIDQMTEHFVQSFEYDAKVRNES